MASPAWRGSGGANDFFASRIQPRLRKEAARQLGTNANTSGRYSRQTHPIAGHAGQISNNYSLFLHASKPPQRKTNTSNSLIELRSNARPPCLASDAQRVRLPADGGSGQALPHCTTGSTLVTQIRSDRGWSGHFGRPSKPQTAERTATSCDPFCMLQGSRLQARVRVSVRIGSQQGGRESSADRPVLQSQRAGRPGAGEHRRGTGRHSSGGGRRIARLISG